MKVHYDPEADVLNVSFKSGHTEVTTSRLSEEQ